MRHVAEPLASQPTDRPLSDRQRRTLIAVAEAAMPAGAIFPGAGAKTVDRVEHLIGARLGGELGWTIIISRASSIRVAGQAIFDSGEIFVGASLQAAYGLVDGSFAMSLD